MKNVSKETVKKIAHLARLGLDEKASEKMAKDLTQILEWVDKLQEVDTEGIEPLTGMSEEENILRKDIAEDTLSHEKALANAPVKDSNYIRVPKVLGNQ